MNAIDWIEIFVTTFVVGAVAWLFWACYYAPDLSRLESEAHAAWLEARRKKQQALGDQDETENGVGGGTAGKQANDT